MTTLLASGMSLRGSARRSKVSAIQVMSPCAPWASQAERFSRACAGGSAEVMRQASKPSARALSLREARIVCARGGAFAGGAETCGRRRGQSFDRMSIGSGIIDASASERRGRKEAAFARGPQFSPQPAASGPRF